MAGHLDRTVGADHAAYEDEMEPLEAFDRAPFGGSPDDIPDRYMLRSSITYVENVRAPVMILAGERDPRCPIRLIEAVLAFAAEHPGGRLSEMPLI